VRIAGIIRSTNDDKLLCFFEDIATGKEVTIHLTEKDENGNEQLVEKSVELPLARDFVAFLQLIAEEHRINSV
jgi:hypothetical protein